MKESVSYAEPKPQIIKDFLTYITTIKGKSPRTASEYYLDLRMFFRFLKQQRGLANNTYLDDISITDIDIDFIKTITLSDAYNFLMYTAQDRPARVRADGSTIGLSSASRARKISSIRSFFKYLTDKAHLLEHNPMQSLEYPSIQKSLPKYLTMEESLALLDAVDGAYKERDYCILTLFLNCGLRVSELCSLNLLDIKENQIRIIGKGNKERILYLNEACVDAINSYLPHRISPNNAPENFGALFVSRNHSRMSRNTVEKLVKKYISQAGLDPSKFSAHKLRHTAATLMYSNGVDIRTLQDVLGHQNVNTTMVYTHINNANIQEAVDRNPLSHVKNKK